MARTNVQLLTLLIIYAAIHRARMFAYVEPKVRIVRWTTDILPALPQPLIGSASSQESNEFLAMSLMMTSLQIISPGLLSTTLNWHYHTLLARSIICARYDHGDMSANRMRFSRDLKDETTPFLISWYARLEIQGGISNWMCEPPPALLIRPELLDYLDSSQQYKVGCTLGTTEASARILFRVLAAARTIRCSQSTDSIRRLQDLNDDINDSRLHGFQACSCSANGSLGALEKDITDTAFCWAAKLIICLAMPSQIDLDHDYATAVREIVVATYKIRARGAASMCLLAPMFIAGCTAWDLPGSRGTIIALLRDMEATSMPPVSSF